MMAGLHAPAVLDVTRTISRGGLPGTTGIDRVERAYLNYLLKADHHQFLAKLSSGYALFNCEGMRRCLAKLDAPEKLAGPDLWSLISWRVPKIRKRSEATARREAIWKGRNAARAPLLPGFRYINVGHTNLRSLRKLKAAGARQIDVMVHDVIPLDHPEFCRPKTPKQFRAKVSAIAKNADRVIFNSHDTQTRAFPYLSSAGRSPETLVAHLGIDPVPKRGQPSTPPCFTILGTIEPRKNHALLLSIWRDMQAKLEPEAMPHLHIIGRRGWENEDVFNTLDTADFMGKSVFEHGALPDDEAHDILAKSCALLLPSFCEGYGLPLMEALDMGLPVLCSDLSVFKELAGEHAVYINPLDAKTWYERIKGMMKNSSSISLNHSGAELGPQIPRWDDHFGTVFGDGE
jgi:glycosyltransferase involved in cell wall biosynthesis